MCSIPKALIALYKFRADTKNSKFMTLLGQSLVGIQGTSNNSEMIELKAAIGRSNDQNILISRYLEFATKKQGQLNKGNTK